MDDQDLVSIKDSNETDGSGVQTEMHVDLAKLRKFIKGKKAVFLLELNLMFGKMDRSISIFKTVSW